MRECAVTLPFPVSLENNGARKTARGRVWRGDADIEHVAAMLSQVGLEIIAQAVIEREFAAHFPVVLGKEGYGVLSSPQSSRNAGIAVVGRSDEKTGVRESDAGWKRHSLESGESRLVGAKLNVARRVSLAERGVPVHDRLAAGFVRVIVANPRQRNVPRRLQVFYTKIGRGGPDLLCLPGLPSTS